MLGHADPVTHVRLTSTRMAASAACAFTAGSPRRTYPRSE
jgi:hypothetical protein